MKGVYISTKPSTRSWVACLYPWVDGKILNTPSYPGIINSGPLSQCGNRSCTHMDVSLALTPAATFPTLNIIPYTYPRSPALRYRSISKNWPLSAESGDSPESYWEYLNKGELQTERTEMYSTGNQIVYRKVSENTNSSGIKYYSWEGFRKFTLVEDAFQVPYVEDWTMTHHGVTTRGVNYGYQTLTWFSAEGTAHDYSSFDPKRFFKSKTWQSLMHRTAKVPFASWGNLSSDCMDGFFGGVNNGIQYTAEMTQLKKLAQPLVDIMQTGVSSKSLASAYLSYEYGLRLTAKDTYSYMSQIKRNRSMRSLRDFSRLYSRDRQTWSSEEEGVHISGTRNLTLFYLNATSFIAASTDRLRRWGFMPSTSIAWDMVPFSFIVDWFAPIGSALEQFDKMGVYDSHEFLEHVATDKYEFTIDSSFFPQLSGVRGKIKITAYFRAVNFGAPKPAMRFNDLNLSSRQIRNGGAILLQNWK